jgi:hypothetical protein
MSIQRYRPVRHYRPGARKLAARYQWIANEPNQ